MALIKKNSEVPSYALIFIPELINSTLREPTRKKLLPFVKSCFLPLHNGSNICYMYQGHLSGKLIMRTTKKRLLFMVFGQLFHSRQSLTGADLGGWVQGVRIPPSPPDDLRFSNTIIQNQLYRLICIFSSSHYGIG